MSQYDDLAGAAGISILSQLYPFDFALPDCPLAADAVDNYLNTGQIVPTPESLVSSFHITAHWRGVSSHHLISIVRGLHSDHHVVVKGTRSRATLRRFQDQGSPRTPNHYFVLANIAGQVYVIDAMTHYRTTAVGRYIRDEGLDALGYTTRYEASEAESN
jgi:hypothetical protein